MALGASSVQVCTAAMVYGFKVVEDMIDGLRNWMDSKGYAKLNDFVGKAVPNFVDWEHLNLSYTVKARIDQQLCIQCGRCYIACEDTSHQAITRERNGQRHFEVIDEECVGCNLCVNVCPVDNCITLQTLPIGAIDPRTHQPVQPYKDWTTHPNNPSRVKGA
jgi:dihydropyrimidine dehydrogenase (NAD+) subunit PreA